MKKFQVVYDLGQYNPVLTPIATEMQRRGWEVVFGDAGDYNRDTNVLGSIGCQSGPWIRKKPLIKPSFYITHSLSLCKLLTLPGDEWSYRIAESKYIEGVLNRKAINKHIKILGLGWSKLDILINNKNKQQEYRDEVKRAFKLDNKPIILFAPTYRKHNHTSKQLPGQPEKLLSIADAIPSCNLIFCPHSMCDYADQDYKYVVNKDSTDKYKYILAADLMISDISGITIEFGVLDKPIVLLNHPNYDHYFSLNDGSGEVVDIGEIVNLSGLHDAVIRNLENPNYWGERRRYWIDKAIDYCCDGKSTPRIVDKIEELV